MTERAEPADLVATFLVERYWPGVTVEAFADAVGRLEASLAGLRREGTLIRTVGSILVPDDEAAYWVVDAPSGDVVAGAWARADVPAERIVGAVDVRPRGRDGFGSPVDRRLPRTSPGMERGRTPGGQRPSVSANDGG